MDTAGNMGNKVSGSSKEEDNPSTETKDGDEADHATSTAGPASDNADPDSAKEIAELGETSPVDLDEEDLSHKSANDGNGSAELHLLLQDSDTESRSVSSKKSSQSTKQRDSNMEDVSSEDEFEAMKPRARCMSAESLASNEEKQPRPETPCLDEKSSAPSPTIPTGCEPLSESDKESEAEKEPELLSLSDAKGIKIVIRSIEEELDDIESEEGSFSEQEVTAKKEKTKNIIPVTTSEEMDLQIKDVETVDPVPPKSSTVTEPEVEKEEAIDEDKEALPESPIPAAIDPVEVGLIEGEELMDIDEILGDREILSESSDKSMAEETSQVVVKAEEREGIEEDKSTVNTESLKVADEIQVIDDSDEEGKPKEPETTSSSAPSSVTIVDDEEDAKEPQKAAGEPLIDRDPKTDHQKRPRFMSLDPPIGDMDIVEIIDDDESLSDCIADEEQEKTTTPATDDDLDNVAHGPLIEEESRKFYKDVAEPTEEEAPFHKTDTATESPQDKPIEETVRDILNESLERLLNDMLPREEKPRPISVSCDALDNEAANAELDAELQLPDGINPISLDDYFSDSNDSKHATTTAPNETTTTSDALIQQQDCDSNSLSSAPPFNTAYDGDSEKEEDDDPLKELKRYSGECINPDCNQSNVTQLFSAPAFVRSFYMVNEKTQVKVCDVCLDQCIGKYGALWDKFETRSLGYADLPLQTEMEIIASSDDEGASDAATATEGGTGGVKVTPEVGAFLEENLSSILSELQVKYRFEEKALDFETTCERQLEEQSAELDEMFGKLRLMMKTVDGYYQKMVETVLPVHSSLERTLRPTPKTHSPDFEPGTVCFAQWKPGFYRQGFVLQLTFGANQNPLYDVHFDAFDGHKNVVRALPPDQVAYGRPRSWAEELMFGSRVIAVDGDRGFSGMVADLLTSKVLVFFEDGHTRYVDNKCIRPSLAHFPSVRHASIVMERHSKPFIRDLFAMALTKEFRFLLGDTVELFDHSQWTKTRVVSVNGPVVLVLVNKKRKMVYAGSPYIRPVHNAVMISKRINLRGPNQAFSTEKYVTQYQQPPRGAEEAAAESEDSSSQKRVQPPRAQSAQQKRDIIQKQLRSKPGQNVEYAPVPTPNQVLASQPAAGVAENRPRRTAERAQPQVQSFQELRQVAKKSGAGASPTVERTSRPRQAVPVGETMPSQYYRHVKNMNNATIYLDEDDDKQGQIMSFVAPKKFSKAFVKHHCSPACTPVVASDLSKYNPLSQPLMAGWKRKIATTNTKLQTVLYKAPCGRSLRNMYEVHHYLRDTQSPFNVDLFEFEVDVQCLSEYRVDQRAIKWQSLDLSEGQEPMPVSCVNYYDQTLPPSCLYSTDRTPTEGVFLNLDEDFLACCDCVDDCLDKSKCQCWQLTIQGERMRDPEIYENDVGYVYKRLPNPVPTGIYECNPRCGCSQSCLNRVVQHKIQLKLQVYKTANRGWGIRCLNDVPKGGFICVYAGHLLTEQKANEEGANLGDEYFAELDYIEVAERLKQGYESEVQDWETDWYSSSSSEGEEEPSRFPGASSYNPRGHLQRKRTTLTQKGGVPKKRSRPQPLRKFYGQNEEIYVMDAKIAGNIGRYFNHSCAPNLFVQNVFVDTHDLRFPWVSFFAMHNIRAGSELTWNYNYEVGSVQGKILICQCGAESCRGRIL